MNLQVWYDAQLCDAWSFHPDQPYVMQRVHTLNLQAHNLDHHLHLLREASEYLFGFASLCSANDAQRIISRLVERSRVNLSYSIPVVIRLDARGRLSFEVERPTFGYGAYLRAKRPRGVFVQCDAPQTVVQTSVTEAVDAMTESRVAIQGGEVAVWTDEYGGLVSRPWRPIFAAYRNRVYTPQTHTSVEYAVACRAIQRAGYELEVRPISCEVLSRMDEIFVVDIMGVSALSEIRQHRLLSAAAKRVADNMEPK